MIVSALFIWFYMTAWHLISLKLKRNDIADVAWGLGFILVAFYSLINWQTTKALISFILIFIWGMRLAIHIYQRNKNKKEDKRYQKFKDNPYLKVFLTQGFLMWLISWPIINISKNLNWLNLLGVLVWIVGFYFESRADKELSDFLKEKNNKGKILQSGLWSLSRHPNYFGEVTMWWGIWILNLSISTLSNWWTIVGPLTITFLILKVSGVPLLEKRYEGNKEFDEYKKRVSVFIPWWPKKIAYDK